MLAIDQAQVWLIVGALVLGVVMAALLFWR